MARILGLGDNVCDMYVHEKRMYPGGQALNVAVYASLLGAQSQYMGTFGTETWRRALRRPSRKWTFRFRAPGA